MSETRRIGLFGGTFDPVHRGHVHIASAAMESMRLDEVRFLPCRISPHKPGSHPSSGDDRLEMLRLATQGLPWAVVDDFELRQPAPSYSWRTAEAIHGNAPEARLFWILGTDQWRELPGWKHPERLAARVEFIVFTRGEIPDERDGFVMHPLEAPHPASATAIRRAIIAGGAAEHPWLDPEVAGWIARRGLYQH